MKSLKESILSSNNIGISSIPIKWSKLYKSFDANIMSGDFCKFYKITNDSQESKISQIFQTFYSEKDKNSGGCKGFRFAQDDALTIKFDSRSKIAQSLIKKCKTNNTGDQYILLRIVYVNGPVDYIWDDASDRWRDIVIKKNVIYPFGGGSKW